MRVWPRLDLLVLCGYGPPATPAPSKTSEGVEVHDKTLWPSRLHPPGSQMIVVAEQVGIRTELGSDVLAILHKR